MQGFVLALTLAFAAFLTGASAQGAPLKVVSFNAYLLAADADGAPSLAERRERLPAALAATGADLVILQEVWSASDREILEAAMTEYGYTMQAKERRSLWPPYFYGNGLAIFAKAPLQFQGEPEMVIFPFFSMLNYDRFTNKGAILTHVTSPDTGLVAVAAAHTSYLPWDAEAHQFDVAKEAKLLQQVAAIRELLSRSAAPVKIVGLDMNTPAQRWNPEAQAYDEDSTYAAYDGLLQDGLVDGLEAAPEVACMPACYTWDQLRNALLREGRFEGEPGVTTDPAERIDYVAFSGAGVRATAGRLVLEEEYALSSGALNLSDHFGVLVELELP